MDEPLTTRSGELVRGRAEVSDGPPAPPAVQGLRPFLEHDLSSTKEEQEIIDHIEAAYAGINRLGLRANGHELERLLLRRVGRSRPPDVDLSLEMS